MPGRRRAGGQGPYVRCPFAAGVQAGRRSATYTRRCALEMAPNGRTGDTGCGNEGRDDQRSSRRSPRGVAHLGPSHRPGRRCIYPRKLQRQAGGLRGQGCRSGDTRMHGMPLIVVLALMPAAMPVQHVYKCVAGGQTTCQSGPCEDGSVPVRTWERGSYAPPAVQPPPTTVAPRTAAVRTARGGRCPLNAPVVRPESRPARSPHHSPWR